MELISTSLNAVELHIRPRHPSFEDLPWDRPVTTWRNFTAHLEEVPTGVTRHPVVFPNYDGSLYAIKEMQPGLAEKEFQVLERLEELRQPVVEPIGYANINPGNNHPASSALITHFLDRSLPYRTLIMRSGFHRYQLHLLDAIAGLLVQLHLNGIYWGDCSLSNTLFRPDAGALQAYLVDAETAEIHSPRLEPTLRYTELEIMEENINDELRDLFAAGQLPQDALEGIPVLETGSYIRKSYLSLWDVITRDELIKPDESYKIQERVRLLNDLGFSIKQIEAQPTPNGDLLRLRVVVTDRNFHRDQLMNLTGVEAQENQARQIMNEILEIQGNLSKANNRQMPLSVAANSWLETVYLPALDALRPMIERLQDASEPVFPVELYIQVLEHKWYLSEQAHHDVGHRVAAEDFLKQSS